MARTLIRQFPVLVILALTAIALACGTNAQAAQFELVFKSCADDDSQDWDKLRASPRNCVSSAEKVRRGRVAVRMTGEIEKGDADRLEKVFEQHAIDGGSFGYAKGGGNYVAVYMSGQAGNVEGAIELGRFFRENAVFTRVARDATCAGACALAFMGGSAQWGRLTRRAVERRLEAGGQLVFKSPIYGIGDAGGDPAAAAERLRERMRAVQSYAVYADIPPLLLNKILALKEADTLPIDTVFWAKVAEIAVDGVLPVTDAKDQDYISACNAQVDWEYGLQREYKEPPFDPKDGEIFHRDRKFLIVAVVASYARYDYWCAINTTRTEEVKIARQRVRSILRKWSGRNSLLVRDYNDDLVLKPNQIYFSKAANDFADTRAAYSLDLLLRAPQTKLAAIADPQFKWNPWSDAQPWFEQDAP